MAKSTSQFERGDAARILIVAAIGVAAALRVGHVWLTVVPSWLALFVLLVIVLELGSVAWNVVRGRPWTEDTVLDRLADALVYLPWP